MDESENKAFEDIPFTIPYATDVFLLPISSNIFEQWLRDRLEWDLPNPDLDGIYSFNYVTRPHFSKIIEKSGIRVLSASALAIDYYYDPKSDIDEVSETELSHFLKIKIIPLGTERVEVLLDCQIKGLREYYDGLVDSIIKRWPNSHLSGEPLSFSSFHVKSFDTPTNITDGDSSSERAIPGRRRYDANKWAREQLRLGHSRAEVFKGWIPKYCAELDIDMKTFPNPKQFRVIFNSAIRGWENDHK